MPDEPSARDRIDAVLDRLDATLEQARVIASELVDLIEHLEHRDQA